MTMSTDGKHLFIGGKNLSVLPNNGKKTNINKMKVKLGKLF